MTQDKENHSPAALKGTNIRPWGAFWAVGVGFFMIMLDTTIMAVAQPAIQVGLHASLSSTVWANTSYMVAYAALMLFTGRLGDVVGPKSVYLWGLVVFAASSLMCGFAWSVSWLIAFRVLQGCGAALMGPQTLAVINRVFPSATRGRAIAYWGAISGVSTFLGPLVGGLLVSYAGWRWVFLVNVPIGVLGVALTVLLVPALPRSRARLSPWQIALYACGLALVVLALQNATSMHSPWQPAALALAGLALLAGFALAQRADGGLALLPLSLFQIRRFSLSTICVILVSIAVNSTFLAVMYYLERMHGDSPFIGALRTVTMAGTTVLLARFVGTVMHQWKTAPMMAGAFLIAMLGTLTLAYVMNPSAAVVWITLGYLVVGIGASFFFSPLAYFSTSNVASGLQGAASGAFNTARIIGSALGNALISAAISWKLAASGLISNPALNGSLAIGDASVAEQYASVLRFSMIVPLAALAVALVAALFFSWSAPRESTSTEK
jgi:EmrB/QacA subfamily drug resistance transporter